MGKLDKIEDWLEDHIMLVIVTVLIILAALFVVTNIIDNHNEKDTWYDFANQVNKDTDYYLDKGYNGTCGYIKTIGSEYPTAINVYQSSPGTTDYARVYAKEGGLALEWHKITPSLGDKVTSTTYIPYESICHVQANKVIW